ncbi:MAG: sigma-70 family RNA polymerase sigma factor [Nocardioidaceae bacterium]|nr:sigma-70 family RNA polymerase sigma factor [Nocardioidaceae bacterium]
MGKRDVIEPLIEATRRSSHDHIDGYLQEIAVVPLLTAEEEVRLAFEIEAGVLAAERLDAGCSDTQLAEELQLLGVIGHHARTQMVQANLRLVVAVARRFRSRGVPLIDLIQEGNLGLLRAVEKFDYRRGCKFSTYAVWWIRQAITRGIAEAARNIRLPVQVMARLNLCMGVRHDLLHRLGRPATNAEVAQACGLDVDVVTHLLRLDNEPVSLDTALAKHGEIADTVVDPDATDPSDSAADAVMEQRLRDALWCLDELEREIVARRYGFAGAARGAQAVATELNLSRDRVRYIETQALRKLRTTPAAATLRDYWCA